MIWPMVQIGPSARYFPEMVVIRPGSGVETFCGTGLLSAPPREDVLTHNTDALRPLARGGLRWLQDNG